MSLTSYRAAPPRGNWNYVSNLMVRQEQGLLHSDDDAVCALHVPKNWPTPSLNLVQPTISMPHSKQNLRYRLSAFV